MSPSVQHCFIKTKQKAYLKSKLRDWKQKQRMRQEENSRIKNTILLIRSTYELHVFSRKTATLLVTSYLYFYILY